jgi:hypothetical protein
MNGIPVTVRLLKLRFSTEINRKKREKREKRKKNYTGLKVFNNPKQINQPKLI